MLFSFLSQPSPANQPLRAAAAAAAGHPKDAAKQALRRVFHAVMASVRLTTASASSPAAPAAAAAPKRQVSSRALFVKPAQHTPLQLFWEQKVNEGKLS